MVNKDQNITESVVCPVGPLPASLPFDFAEIEPLLQFLTSNAAASEVLPFQRGTVTAAQTLDCCKQALGPAGASLITEALKGNNKIRAILLGTGSIANEGAASVAELLRENTSIETVYLGCNLIDAQGMQSLTASLEGNPQVHALWLKRNPLGVDGAKALARLLGKNRNLRTLDLVNTLVGNAGLAALVDALVLEDYPLERLYLSGNFLDETASDTLAKLLRGNRHLQELYLSVNRLGDAGVSRLAEALQENQHLKVLSLASNGFGRVGAEALSSALVHHPRMESLDLGYARSTKVLGGAANQIGDAGAHHLAQLIRQNPSLIHLDIRKNGIGILGLKAISGALSANDQLQELVHDNIRVPWLKQEIREKLHRNRVGKTMPPIPADVQAVKSVYR
ncbi:MAG: hypothetical protein RLZZ519_2849 [Bacteroidota bacterium]|jgi:Ran GTPase-activating protein (RanGAP) involved in mRNA processing and transport